MEAMKCDNRTTIIIMGQVLFLPSKYILQQQVIERQTLL